MYIIMCKSPINDVHWLPIQILAGVAELADAQDLKSCGLIIRTGSIPVSGTITAEVRDQKSELKKHENYMFRIKYRGVEQYGSSSGS